MELSRMPRDADYKAGVCRKVSICTSNCVELTKENFVIFFYIFQAINVGSVEIHNGRYFERRFGELRLFYYLYEDFRFIIPKNMLYGNNFIYSLLFFFQLIINTLI